MKQLMQPGDIVITSEGGEYTCITMDKALQLFKDLKPYEHTEYIGLNNLTQNSYLQWDSFGNSALKDPDFTVVQVIPKEKPMQTTKQPRKHSELIKAWADGAEIQYKSWQGVWESYLPGDSPMWDVNSEYRIKPEVKPDVVMYAFVNEDFCTGTYPHNEDKENNLKLTFDGETGDLKSAEVIEREYKG